MPLYHQIPRKSNIRQSEITPKKQQQNLVLCNKTSIMQKEVYSEIMFEKRLERKKKLWYTIL